MDLAKPARAFRVLHTADWHLGKRLCEHSLEKAQGMFLAHLLRVVDKYAIDALLIAGDVYDTITPTHSATKLYYDFLANLAHTCCRHVVIIAGNHDSASFLDASASVLGILDELCIHVVGAPCIDEANAREIITLQDDEVRAVVLATPYLRERDVRTAQAGESVDVRKQEIERAIHARYVAQGACALAQAQALGVPCIAMGHLLVLGGTKESCDDGMRDLYIGGFGQVSADMFDEAIDYVALGHIHKPQKINGRENVRYSGSPLPMGFDERDAKKQLVVIDFIDTKHCIHCVPLPSFLHLHRLTGSDSQIIEGVQKICDDYDCQANYGKCDGQNIALEHWLEVLLEIPNPQMRHRLQEVIGERQIHLVRVVQPRSNIGAQDSLSVAQVNDMSAHQIFDKVLVAYDIDDDALAHRLHTLYAQILHKIQNENPHTHL